MIGIQFDVPVDPDAPDARELLIDELSKAPYQAAKPTFFDELVTNFTDWLQSLTVPTGADAAPNGLLILIFVVLVVAILGVAFLIFGLPRLNRRSQVTGSLFGEDDARDSAAMRRDAERAAASGDYTTAIAELYRALARGLAERTLVDTFPGTTAHDFARRAGEVFPDAVPGLTRSATAFDSVRYLDAAGTAAQWNELVVLERQLRTAKPVRSETELAGAAAPGVPS